MEFAMKNIIELTEANFETEVLRATGPVLVDFYAPWCGPCLMLAPLLEQFAVDFAAKVKEITGGKGVPVVYDSVGKDTFAGSLDCLSPRGLMVSFGNSSGAVPPFFAGARRRSIGFAHGQMRILGHRLRARADVQLAVDMTDVIMHRVVTDAE